MRTRLVLSLAGVGLVVGATTSSAQDQELGPQPALPPLATLDRVTDETNFNTSLAMSFYDGADDLTLLQLDLLGQVMSPSSHAGGYVSLPLSYASTDDDSDSEIGNLELGGVMAVTASPTTTVLLRGGLTLPTAGDGFVSFVGGFGRLTDLVNKLPEATVLRLAVSPITRQRTYFLRADLGADVPIDTAADTNPDPLVRINLAAGIYVGKGSISGELVSLGTTGDIGDEDRFIHTAAVSFAYDSGGARPYAALVIPILGGDDEDLDFSPDAVLMAGVEVPFAF